MQVKWTQRALNRLNIAVNYGLREFGETTTRQFYEKIKSYEPLLATNPYMGKVEKVLENRQVEYRSFVGSPAFQANLLRERKEAMCGNHLSLQYPSRPRKASLLISIKE